MRTESVIKTVKVCISPQLIVDLKLKKKKCASVILIDLHGAFVPYLMINIDRKVIWGSS